MKYRTAYPNELYHHGILGMKWGVRRYQNYDGTRIGTGGAPVIKPSSLKDGVQRVGTGGAQRSSIPKALKKSVAGGQGGKSNGLARLAATAGGASNNDETDKKPLSKRDALLSPTVKKGKGKEDTSAVQEITKSAGNILDESKTLAEEFKKSSPKVKAEKQKQEKTQTTKARQMSDKELRDNINRIKMEREYVSLTTKETKTGYDKVVDIIDKARPFVRIAAEIAGLIALMYKIKSLRQSGIDEYSIEDDRAEIYEYCVNNNIDSDIIVHAMAFDLDYILEYYNISEEDLMHILNDTDELYHHGIKGQKWGVRRFQNYDGTRIGTGSGVGGGGGGGSKASKSFRDKLYLKGKKKHLPVGDGLISPNNKPKLAASVQDTKRSKNTQEAIDAYKKAQEISDKEVRPLQEKLWDSEYDFHHPNNQKTVQALEKAIEKRDSYVDTYVKKFKDIPYNEIDDDVLKMGQHFNTFKYTKEVDENYKGPVIISNGKRYKHESINPYVEVLGDAPGGEMALRRKPKVVDKKADEELKKKLANDLRKSQKQDARDYYRIKTFGK